MKRLVTLSLVFGVTAFALAMPTFVKTFEDTYKVSKDSELGKAACGTCHMGAKGGKLNPYGKDLEAAMKAANSKKLTKEILAKVENLDSDKDGVKNIDEIKKGATPGK